MVNFKICVYLIQGNSYKVIAHALTLNKRSKDKFLQ